MKTKLERIDTLLELLDRKSLETRNAADRALWHALTFWKDQLPDLDDRFHKTFRQCDVTDDGHTDMILWCLLDHSTLFWELFEQVRKET